MYFSRHFHVSVSLSFLFYCYLCPVDYRLAHLGYVPSGELIVRQREPRDAFMMRFKLLDMVVGCLLLWPVAGKAQSDFGTSLSVAFDKRIDSKLTVGVEMEMRTRDNAGAIDRLSGGLRMRYKCLPWLKVSAGSSFLGDHVKHISFYDSGDRDVVKGLVEVGERKNLRTYWRGRLRGDVALTATKKYGRLQFTFRERWQYTYRFKRYMTGRYNYLYKKSDHIAHYYSGKGKNELRSRVMASYDWPGIPLEPFVSGEVFNTTKIEKVRYMIGAEYKLQKRHIVGFYYRFQDEMDENDNHPDRHIIGLTYTLRF